ncbi:hypothetical protein CHS0354_029876 [Potamilus streckersoni]|uniref:Uncharacterized protein n=1 Tax=Potamilus streckersoni TaxID=2493646 RepID=A0AAE0TGJ3_9BIVA|nr:hypothetical protein CHS0354_029876 [Potamilus streckersoni]
MSQIFVPPLTMLDIDMDCRPRSVLHNQETCIDWEDDKQLQELDFADNTALMAASLADMQQKIYSYVPLKYREHGTRRGTSKHGNERSQFSAVLSAVLMATIQQRIGKAIEGFKDLSKIRNLN